ncbi:hypothetical protein CHLNCDRAFT_145084 [Chlorella variabilis]|uniref:Transmembrane protein 14C n=1 Tax=Chlorella variabilis TaxID=554065 RepID=E1ZCJ4_CHLVA|nr:hypothetical protein CHLNCDRAFT_145084 [Chlorella variabilis]EFN56253.1 hypothetical protein CHLNCDRAFT_145084 [Chlorella variabilis]|eukprot:XP_005848355.1 hypothetical protein CHLNCDRAFT_145084 [Chlorella variabilis]
MAALVAAGGISGYATRRSMPSLVAGLGIAALFASLALVSAMAPRYARTHKVWPAGLMALTGALSAIYQGLKTREWLA